MSQHGLGERVGELAREKPESIRRKRFCNYLRVAHRRTLGVTGPYLVEGCDLPADMPTAVKDMLPYFETEGATAPALEFVSPVKGPALEQITVEVGSGIRKADAAAKLYDQDVQKQAQQLGLPGW